MSVPILRADAVEESKLGSFMGSKADKYNKQPLFNGGSTIEYMKAISDMASQNWMAYNTEYLVKRVGDALNLGKPTIDEAILTVRSTVARTRKLKTPYPVLSVHALTLACRLAGRADIPLKRIIEAHEILGHRIKNRSLNILCQEFPLPRMDLDTIIATGIRKLLADPSNIEKCRNLLDEARSVGKTLRIMGHNHTTVAASAIWIASKNLGCGFSQRQLGALFGIAEYTVREFIMDHRRSLLQPKE